MGEFVSGGLRDLLLALAAVGAMLVLSGCSMWRGTPQQQAYHACMAQHPEPHSGYGLVNSGLGPAQMLMIAGGVAAVGDSDAHKQWVADEHQCQIMAFGHE